MRVSCVHQTKLDILFDIPFRCSRTLFLLVIQTLARAGTLSKKSLLILPILQLEPTEDLNLDLTQTKVISRGGEGMLCSLMVFVHVWHFRDDAVGWSRRSPSFEDWGLDGVGIEFLGKRWKHSPAAKIRRQDEEGVAGSVVYQNRVERWIFPNPHSRLRPWPRQQS